MVSYQTIAFPAPNPMESGISPESIVDKMTCILEDKDILTPVFHYPIKQKNKKKRCIIYSHGNGEDISSTNQYVEMAQYLSMDVIAYDYMGYGATYTGKKPDEETVYQNLKQVVEYAHKIGFEDSQIVLIGRSIGTAVTLKYAASHSDFNRIVLISPMTSAKGFIKPLVMKHCIPDEMMGEDLLLSYDNLKKVDPKIPIYFIHGKEDDLVTFKEHGLSMYNEYSQRMKESTGKNVYPPLWIIGAGHNDYSFKYGNTRLFNKIKEFIYAKV